MLLAKPTRDRSEGRCAWYDVSLLGTAATPAVQRRNPKNHRTMTLAEKLSYLAAQRAEDEAALLPRAANTGVEASYRDALTEAYLEGREVAQIALHT